MIDRCTSILRAQLDELRRLLDGCSLPNTTVDAIRAELARMEQIIDDMKKGRD